MPFLLVGCDNSENDDATKYTIYIPIDGEEYINLSGIADLSNYIDLDITINDLDVASADYIWEENMFYVIPKKTGKTTMTVKEKNRVKYIFDVIIDYNANGNWILGKREITIECDADIKEKVEKDLNEKSLFFNTDTNKLYYSFAFQWNTCKVVSNSDDFSDLFLEFQYDETNKFYIFNSIRDKGVTNSIKFNLIHTANLGDPSLNKQGVFISDFTDELKVKYPNNNIIKVIERVEGECWY